MNTTPNQVAKNDRLVWVDCEMTGLDPDQHVLVEIAVIVTDADLTPLAVSYTHLRAHET